ncbi:MAG: 30S ribosomal protein S19 [Candidatus Amesbacteria bacterium GW2011_GWA2_42_12]|uniref:Small ribosomal subunit protein uS19 n=1 Tax=Candidatus Amesbacteria bacterium GW2011_GWA2_42_12 TaxID=1618356 RepID=A0A0G0Y963_9BACT|nr:MAG: 30S ribosomal protein S19 [Candidatus Amesbacteria bacterium GW2011_GWA2_42_12]
MSRSNKKGPYVDPKLLIKIQRMAGGTKSPIKTWSRDSQVSPEFVGHTFSVHNGNKFIDVFINESMVGHRLGEFSPTRSFRGHGAIVKRTMDKT